MGWIKTRNLLPPTHEVIIFQDRWGNEHYGVLCGEFVEAKKRNKYMCHIYQKYYSKKDIVYWCDIPFNKEIIKDTLFTEKTRKFLHEKCQEIEKNTLKEFERLQEENPDWKSENFVGIAVRNSLFRFVELLTGARKE